MKKNFGIFEIKECLHGQGRGEGAEPVRTRKKGSIFREFVRTSFMDGP